MTVKRVMLFAFFMTCGAAMYAGVILYGPFIYDDAFYIVSNSLVQKPELLREMAEPRYVTYLTFFLNSFWGGLNPQGFHALNVIIHVTNSFLVYFLALQCIRLTAEEMQQSYTCEQAVPFSAALVFLAHPLATQSVSYITQRFTSLSAFFYLSAAALYLWGRSRLDSRKSAGAAALALSFACTVLGMKTKETVFTLPLMLVLLEWLFFRSSSEKLAKRLALLLPFLATMLIVPLSLYGPGPGTGYAGGDNASELSRQDKLFDLSHRSSSEYLIIQFRVLVTYLRLMAVPYGQRVIYDYPAYRSVFDPPVLISCIFLIAMASGGFLLLKRSLSSAGPARIEQRLTGLGILWFFITISVESSIIPIKDVIFEHRTYLPSAGIFLAAAALASATIRRLAAGRTPVLLVIVFLLIGGILGTATYCRNRVWSNTFAFWDDAVKKAPGRPQVWQNRGWELMLAGRFSEALGDMDAAISLGETLYERGSRQRNFDALLMQLASAYRDRSRLHSVMSNNDAARRDYRMMEQRLDELSSLTGLTYMR